VHVHEDRKPRHQSRRQRRTAGLVGIDRAEPLLQEAPVDRPAELGERVIHVDDLIEPRPEKDRSARCPAALSAASNHPPSSRRRDRITTKPADQIARNQANSRSFLTNAIVGRSTETPQKSGESGYFTGDGIVCPVASGPDARFQFYRPLRSQTGGDFSRDNSIRRAGCGAQGDDRLRTCIPQKACLISADQPTLSPVIATALVLLDFHTISDPHQRLPLLRYPIGVNRLTRLTPRWSGPVGANMGRLNI
jgi:hypothetical protein